MKISGLFILTLCVICVSGTENSGENVRSKRTLHLMLKAFADSLGYDVMKRPPLPTNAIAKPAGDRGKVNPAGPPMPPPKTLGQQMPKAPAPPAMKPAPPMVPITPKAPPPPPPPPKPAPAPKATPAPPVATRPLLKFPTAPPLLTETVQKMFNINFNWGKNLLPIAPASKAPMPAPAPAPAPSPAPKMPPPPPPPKAPQPAPAPAPAPAPSPVPSQPPQKGPAAPASTAGPSKHVLFSYDYDDPQIAYPQSLKDYDAYYQYENPEVQQAPIQSEDLKQPEQSQEQDNSEGKPEQENQNGNEAYGVIQNFWQNSPWNASPEENKQEESRVQELAGHNFVVSHPDGMSYSKMEHKKVETPRNENLKQNNFGPIYYYEEQQQPPLESKSQKLDQQSYHFQGPSFDQYFYFPENSAENGKSRVEINSSGEQGLKVPQESRQKLNLVPEAGLPVPAHNIYQESPFLQWIGPFEASSEQKEQKVQAKQQNVEQSPKENGAQPQQQWVPSYETSGEQKQQNGQEPFYQWVPQYEAGSAQNNEQKVEQKPQNNEQSSENNSEGFQESPLFAFKYEPDHYSADFTAQTIPPQSQEDYSKYEASAPIKIENEFSDKVQISEEGFGRKYTQVRTDPLIKRRVA